MKIGAINSIGNTAAVQSVQRPQAKSVDAAEKAAGKKIENDIDQVEQQKQALSSKGDIPVDEKVRRRQELQQELSSLKTKLRMNESEMKREEQKDSVQGVKSEENADGRIVDKTKKEDPAKKNENEAASLQTNAAQKEDAKGVQTTAEKNDKNAVESAAAAVKTADNSKTGNANAAAESASSQKEDASVQAANTAAQTNNANKASEDKKEKAGKPEEQNAGFSQQEIRSAITGRENRKQLENQGRVVARIENDIVIQKGEIRQDEARGVDTADKREELKAQEEKAQRATNAQFAMIGQTNRDVQQAQAGTVNGAAVFGGNDANQPLIRATNYALEGTV